MPRQPLALAPLQRHPRGEFSPSSSRSLGYVYMQPRLARYSPPANLLLGLFAMEFSRHVYISSRSIARYNYRAVAHRSTIHFSSPTKDFLPNFRLGKSHGKGNFSYETTRGRIGKICVYASFVLHQNGKTNQLSFVARYNTNTRLFPWQLSFFIDERWQTLLSRVVGTFDTSCDDGSENVMERKC